MVDGDIVADEIVDGDIVTIRPESEVLSKQKLPNFVGISGATTGAQGISMNLVVIPAGGAAKAHFHRDYETAVYLLKGRVKTLYGKGLKKSVINEAGDFIYIPPGVPHQPQNLSSEETALALVSRNDPNEQENVVLYEPAE
ncbi:MAG: cupin domain-containing protein [Cyanobacteria bacterium P01_H01_bin.15]